MTIEVHNLNKRFGSVVAAHDVSLRVREGSLTALLGPSGSGKTTVLRSIAGLEIPDSGTIIVSGRDVTHLPPQKREIGFVFQQYALFRHMRVADNIAFPLRVRKWKKDAIRERVAELLALFKIEGLERRYPDQISGGQRQRVAFARALAAHPQVLLLDEPFSALDARVRDELREWLRALHDQLHVTSLFVTHDQSEAMELADEVVVMREGRVAQIGTPAEIARRPASSFVMNFLGRTNALEGTASHGVARLRGIEVPFAPANGVAMPVVGYFRPQQVTLTLAPATGSIRAQVTRLVPTGLGLRVSLQAEDGLPLSAEIDARVGAELGLQPGDWVYAAPWEIQVFARDDAHVLAGEGAAGVLAS